MGSAIHPQRHAMSAADKRDLLARIEQVMDLCEHQATPEELAAAASVCATPPTEPASPQAALPLRFE